MKRKEAKTLSSAVLQVRLRKIPRTRAKAPRYVIGKKSVW